MKKQNCNKKKFDKIGVMGFLKKLKLNGYANRPWRNEVSYYKCDKCGCYHTSSKLDVEGKTLIKDKSYFDFQKENWNNFLQNKSAEKAIITNKISKR